MRTAYRVMLLAVVAAVVAGATAGARFFQESRYPQVPVLDYPPLVDLGERDFGEIATGRFQVHNTGRSELQLTQFRTSCSCAGVEIEEDGQPHRVQQINIPSGSLAELSVRVAVGGRPGTSQYVAIQFETNDPARPVGTIEVIVPRVKGGAYPDPRAVLLGVVPIGGESRQVVRLYDNGVHDRKVEQIRSTRPKQFEIRLLPTDAEGEPQLHPSAGRLFGRFEVIAHTEQAGRLDGDIEVMLAGEQFPSARISVRGEVISAVACSPSALVLPRSVAGRVVRSGEIQMVSRDGKPCRVEVVSVPDGLTATVRAVPGHPDRQLLQIECGAVSGSVCESQLQLRFQPESGQAESLAIPVTHPRGGS